MARNLIPRQHSPTQNPSKTTICDLIFAPQQIKQALTLPPRTLFPPSQPLNTDPRVLQSQGTAALNPQTSQAMPQNQGAGAGRPTGPAQASGTLNGNPTAQTGMPGQPSAVASLGGISSSSPSKGFGNTPSTSSTSSTSSGSKSANALGSIGTHVMGFIPIDLSGGSSFASSLGTIAGRISFAQSNVLHPSQLNSNYKRKSS